MLSSITCLNKSKTKRICKIQKGNYTHLITRCKNEYKLPRALSSASIAPSHPSFALSYAQFLTHQTLLSCTHHRRYTGLNYWPLFNKAMDCLRNGTGTAVDYIESPVVLYPANVRFLLFTSLNSCTPANGYWFCQRWMGVAVWNLKTKKTKKGWEEEEEGWEWGEILRITLKKGQELKNKQ